VVRIGQGFPASVIAAGVDADELEVSSEAARHAAARLRARARAADAVDVFAPINRGTKPGDRA
jgi:hypothetical protein